MGKADGEKENQSENVEEHTHEQVGNITKKRLKEEKQRKKEKDLYEKFQQISLLEVYQHFTKYLIHSPDKADNYLSRDGDAQVFQQLLGEDDDEDEDGCSSALKLIDIA